MWTDRPPRFVFPVALALIQIVGSVGAGSEQPQRRSIDVLAVVLLLAGPAALAFLRRRPVVMAVVAMAVTVTYYVVGYPYGPVFASLAVALFWLVASGGRVAGWLIAAVGLAAATGLQAAVGRGNAWPLVHFAAVAGWLVTVLVVGEIGRVRGERVAEARKARAEEERRRASEERLQVAQELHDVLAHNISLISVQAGVGLHLMDDQPDRAREALVAIKAASRDALGELRSVLDLLRGTGEAAPRQPTAGLDQLERVVAKAAATGLDVQVETAGVARELPAEVDLAALRITQEALTNVARHAGAAHARVRLAYEADELVVEVDDDGRGVSGAVADNGGKGITGMRERAAALGGVVDAGPGPAGGFRVRARLPLATP
ncbi:MAG: sensor histidine kinase [Acidimicrobiales bacterium]